MQCPAAPPRSQYECAGHPGANCWSPGQPDTDCPGHGLCCHDGCANTCVGHVIPVIPVVPVPRVPKVTPALAIEYTVAIPLLHLGWVTQDLGYSTILLGQYVTTTATKQPGELPKSKPTQPGCRSEIATVYCVMDRNIIFSFTSL